MKHLGVAILHLEAVSTYMVLQAVKQAIHPDIQFFDSLSLHPPIIVDELFQKGNQYAMLEDDTIIATKRTVASMTDLGRYSHGRGKRSYDSWDRRDKHKCHDLGRTNSPRIV